MSTVSVALAAHARDVAASGQTPNAADLQAIVSKMEQARFQSRQTIHTFQMRRDYRMFHGTEQTPTAEVVADVSFAPPNSRDFKIVETRGSDHGEKVVRKLLEHEKDTEQAGCAASAVTSANYNFDYIGTDTWKGRPVYLLGIHPKRKDASLIDGRAWVDSQTYLVQHVEGEISKSPSWWVHGVQVKVDFGDVNGMWMQTHSEAVAEVRLIGMYTIRGDAVSVQNPTVVAQATPTVQSVNARGRRSVQARNRSSWPTTVVLQPGMVVPR